MNAQSMQPIAVTRQEVIRSTVAKLYIRHWTELEIADHLEITLAEVATALQEISHSWAKIKLNDLDALKVIELAKLDQLESVYAKEWQASRVPTDVFNEDGEVVLGYKPGNIDFLHGIKSCISERCSLLGLNVKQIEVKGNTGGGLAALLENT